MKVWRLFFRILILFWIGKINIMALFLLEMTWNFLCRIYKIAVVLFCLYIVRNCNQSCTYFQFSPRVVLFKFSPANNLIILGTWTWSFRQLEHQNPSIISGDIGRARSVQQFRNGRTEQNGTERSTVVLDDRIRCIVF